MTRFEVYRSGIIRRGWRWRLRAGNGEIIAHGQSYTRKSDAEEGVRRVRALAPAAEIVVLP